MQTDNDGNLLEIIDLAHTLRQEQLFIVHEQAAFANLNVTLTRNSSNVAELAWICAQQRQNLNDLIISRPETGPSICCQRANRLENTQFIDAYKAKGLKYQHVLSYVELFHYLHRSPCLLAQSLAAADRISKMTTDQINSVVHTIATALYANAIHSKDVEMVLQLLRELIEIQIVVSENPRRMLRAGSSAFSRLYHRLHESLFSAKIFLTAALYEPVMKVLTESETILDMDPNKAILNFTNKERLRRFGPENTSEYNENIRKYHEDTISQLHYLANLFIDNITKNWSLFPSTLRWLVQTMYHQLKQAHINDKDINEIITDMVFTHFICPAVVSPDIFGITDAPISEQARFNLIQIGQIIQMLALMRYEDVDPKYSEVFQKFQTNVIADLLQQLLVSDNDLGIDVVAIRSQQSDFERAKVLLTQNELNTFVDFLRIVLDYDELIISGEDRRKLGKILDQLPDKFETIVNGDIQPQIQITQEHGNRAKQSLINLGKSTKNKLAKTMSLNIDDSYLNNSNSNHHNHHHQNGGNGVPNISPVHSTSSMGSNSSAIYEDSIQVLVFPITIADDSKLRLLTEEEVLKMNSIGQEIDVDPTLNEESIEKLDKVDQEFDNIGPVLRPSHVETTRFSLSHDDASIGNSDNLEAVSEAPSNHSVTSSLELEENDPNDNLSDMVSANVSGRGTPNISGRDTPSSQVTDGENVANQIPTPQMAKIINKARSDIEDKFCKFEIKKLIEGDETISIISDTWSTDVLASDSETLDQNDRDRNFSTPLIPSAVVLPGDNNFNPLSNSRPQIGGNYLDATETRSESAWSTDVLASDSEKLAEVDTDDNLSITAKSDITDAGRSECCDTGRDQDGCLNDQNRTPDSPYFAPRAPNASNFITPDSPMYTPRTSESPFFGTANTYDESSRDTARLFSSPISSLARSSVRTTNQYSGENTFQQNYKSSSTDRGAFLSSSQRMRRQNSAESSISNQSLNDDAYGGKLLKQERDVEYRRQSTKDLIDFSDFNEDGATGIDRKSGNGPIDDDDSYRNFSEEAVIHRRISSEQRNASFDGRRNGIMDFKVTTESSSAARRIQSLNYENHEIIIKKSPQRVLSIPNSENSLIDAVKKTQDMIEDMLLIQQKTKELHISNMPNGNIIEEGNPIKPSKSTGAIPKSISFDASADKSERSSSSRRLQDPLRLHGSGFFHKIKQGFKSRRGNKNRLNSDEFSNRTVSFGNSGNIDTSEADINRTKQNENGYVDLTEDILAKYRRKVSTSSENTNSDSTGGSCSVNRKNSDIEPRTPNGILSDKVYAFMNAKRKIRTVLSTTDLHTGDFRHTTYSNASSLLTYLQIQLAQALNLQNFQQISYVSEAIRCLNSLDQTQHQKIIEELRGDIIKRQSYLQYLMRYRQNLLSIIENICQFEERLRSDREVCNRHLIGVCVRMFLEKREHIIEKFQEEFCGLAVVDEKMDLLEEFMGTLMDELKIDGIIHGMADWQLEEARISIERILLHRLYKQVMFPNDDVDVSRDEVLHEHIRKLQRLITPSHTALRIPQEYLSEAPWPFAQQQISYISAYKTPREKLQCVIRCISSIMNLLQIACDRIPAADDLIPVLIYVVIKANPPYLLSTIQYVNCFIADKLDGQDQFHWTQFCSVVQFIKTMDYLEVLHEHIRKLQRLITPSHTALRIPQEYLSEAPWPFAQQQISYISAYKTPREKLQCVIRCISSIMNLLQIACDRIPAADDLIPVLIYVVIKANPPYLLSTIQYVNCFIADKLDGQDQFHWTQFCSVVQFIKTMDYLD